MSRDEIIAQAKHIQGWMNDADLISLYELSQKFIQPNGFAAEIGVWKGLSTFVIGSVCKEKGALLYAIDTFAGVEDKTSYKNKPENVGSYFQATTDPEFYKIFVKNMQGLPVVPLKGDSQKIMQYIPDDFLDFCFIDGNHNHPVVDIDIANGNKKVTQKGLLCGHDHGNKERPEGQPYGSDVSEAVDIVLGERFVGWDLYSSADVPITHTSIWVRL